MKRTLIKIFQIISSIVVFLGAAGSFLIWLNITPKQISGSKLFLEIMGILNFPIPLFVVFAIVFIFLCVIKFQTKPGKLQEAPTVEPSDQITQDQEFLEEEALILALLTKADGDVLDLTDIANGIKKNNIRTQHGLDRLDKRGYISKNFAAGFTGVVYGLSALGREDVVKRGVDKVLIKEQNESKKTPYDLFIDFLNKKATEDILSNNRMPSHKEAMIDWQNKLDNGLILFFGDPNKIPGHIRLIFSDIAGRVTGFQFYNYNEDAAKKAAEKCQSHVFELIKHINPTMMAKDFNPYDLDK